MSGPSPRGAQGAARPHEGGQAEQEDEPERSGPVPAAPLRLPVSHSSTISDCRALRSAPVARQPVTAPRALSQLAALVAEAWDSQASWTTSVSSLSVSSPIRAARTSTER